MVVEMTEITRDLAIDHCPLISLLPQGSQNLTRCKISRKEIILVDVEPVCTFSSRHGRIGHRVQADGNSTDLHLNQWLMDELHVMEGHDEPVNILVKGKLVKSSGKDEI